jgi:hypothetical protein
MSNSVISPISPIKSQVTDRPLAEEGADTISIMSHDIKSLKIDLCQEFLPKLATTITTNHTITKLTLSLTLDTTNCLAEGKNLQTFMNALRKSRVTELAITNYEFYKPQDDFIITAPVLQGLQQCANITTLKFVGCKFDDDAITCMTDFSNIYLEDCWASSRAMQLFATAVKNSKKLQSLHLKMYRIGDFVTDAATSLFPALGSNNSITTIALESAAHEISDNETKQFLEGVRKNKHITSITFSGPILSDANAAILVDILKSGRIINLALSALKGIGVRSVSSETLQAIIQALPYNSQLKTLNLSGNSNINDPQIIEALANLFDTKKEFGCNTTLEELDLTKCGIDTFNDAKPLFNAMFNNYYLRHGLRVIKTLDSYSKFYAIEDVLDLLTKFTTNFVNLEYIDLSDKVSFSKRWLSEKNKQEYSEQLTAGFNTIIQLLKLNPKLEFGPNLKTGIEKAERDYNLSTNMMSEFSKSGMKLRAMTQPQFTGHIMLKSQGEKKLHDCKFRFV